MPPRPPARVRPLRPATFASLASVLALGQVLLMGALTPDVRAAGPAGILAPLFSAPPGLGPPTHAFPSPLRFENGSAVTTPDDWARRRLELLAAWHREMGAWPPLLKTPGWTILHSTVREGFHQHRVRLEIAAGRFEEGWFLVPGGPGPFPGVIVPFYDPETSIGLKGRQRDLALQLTRRGFVTLSIGSPGGDARQPEPGIEGWQPLSFLAYVAANAHTALAQRAEVDGRRIGIVGHSYGGKWALFAGAFHAPFAAVAVSDPGIVWDESRPNVNYWEPWYLGRDPAINRRPGPLSADSPRTGAYRRLVAAGRDLTEVHALIAPRPFLVSGGAEDPPARWHALEHRIAVDRVLGVSNRVAMSHRPTHDPTPESNAQIVAFFAHFLGPVPKPSPAPENPRPDAAAPPPSERLRLIVETDAGGDPDDEQSLVRFLLLASEWDVEAIIANRRHARPVENRNPERTGLGIVLRLIDAYGQCHPLLVRHDPRFPSAAVLRSRTLAGYDDRFDAVRRIIEIVDAPDPRPIWYSDWGTDVGGDTNNLRRALDWVRSERGPEAYARFKSRLRLASHDAFGPHTASIPPAFPLFVNTFLPSLEGRRWYHRFSALTSRAGGFDLERDVLTGHGPLGALYPTNTTHWAKEGDSMTFLYLMPNGLNSPEQPGWGGWAGRYGTATNSPAGGVYWANQGDAWDGRVHRDNTLGRWAVALQNEFRARLDWCVRTPNAANHPPVPALRGPDRRTLRPGDVVTLDARESRDPDGDALRFEWFHYPEPGGSREVAVRIRGADTAQAAVEVPAGTRAASVHVILALTDAGEPPLTRYRRIVLDVAP